MNAPHDVIRLAMNAGPVIPVLVIEQVEDAVPLAHALLRGGVTVLEVTLRTAAAFDVIEALAQAVPQATIAAGTITTPRQWEKAARAGAHFGVSPGLTPALLEATRQIPLPLLPGVATASELMTAMDAGYERFKFFPAQQAGGVPMLKAFMGPFADALFCPTGGITPSNALEYLALPNVVCVGGSWLAPQALLQDGRWDEIEALARAATALT